MGGTKDPADGKAVAGSVFAAVVVYAVCDFIPLLCWALDEGKMEDMWVSVGEEVS